MEFELEIEKAEGRYRAQVRRSPVRRSGRRAKSSFDLPDDEVLEDLSQEIASLRSGPRHLPLDRPQQGMSARDLGRRLFESVFSGPVLVAWRASVATAGDGLLLRLRLDDDPRLLRVPWELLFDPEPGEFIAAERRFIRSLDLQVEPRPLGAPTPLRILVVLSCPLDAPPLETRKEWAVLDEALGGNVELTVVPPRLEAVDRALRSGEWDVLHFIGHGHADAKGGILILEGRQGEAQAVDHLHLGKYLGRRVLRLIVLNACEGARPGQSDAFSGVAQAIVRKEVPAVVAMQKPISDEAAITFSKAFYGALAEGRTVAEAMWRAREDLFRDHEAEWSVPVLYLNGPDEPLIIPELKPPPRVPVWKVVASVLGVLLLGFGIWFLMKLNLDDTDPPRYHPDCPSPPGLDMILVRIDPGIFDMGETKGDKTDEPVHRVTLTKPFCLGAFEVTQAQWNHVFKLETPAAERDLPVRSVTFGAAQDFISRLNAAEISHPYRLPTEAEWEYAARARTSTRYSFGDDPKLLPQHGNCLSQDGFDGPAPVGSFQPNIFGLFDMYGNVFEWVEDWYAPYSADRVIDPRGPVEGTRRIRRGGSWDSGARACSSAARSDVEPDRKDQQNGFRIVREIR